MTLSLFVFVLLAVTLVGILAWTGRAPRRKPWTADQIFAALSSERHSLRLPAIVQALQPEDVAFLVERGHRGLRARLVRERHQIALRYLNQLQEDFEMLLEASRLLAVLSPEVIAMHEWERLKLSVRFSVCCAYLRWKLRLGLEPWRTFDALSTMAGSMALRVETATARMGERAAVDAAFSSTLQGRRG